MSWREKTESYFKELQDRIVEAVEGLDGQRFREDNWSREGGGGGRTRVLEGGNVFEKCGVNFSSVHGNLPEQFAAKIPLGSGTSFFATGISLVLHPRSPMVPAVHANFRYLEKGDAEWFGGGTDLTPCYPYDEDAVHFHMTLKDTCDHSDRDFTRDSRNGVTNTSRSNIVARCGASAASSSTTFKAIANRTSHLSRMLEIVF